ncbi:unnamed protein product [Dimorphilus gyrociliatus]|uniref:Calcineurin-like phosphoesterase domain-containing protein n=1 Tax=Dimorphilus gyrociliatus TaxID=2664684 RepID=A0A7I8WCU4_9ANNE|nr:unnamed protein product [Dimorphilus gyrociliatus]
MAGNKSAFKHEKIGSGKLKARVVIVSDTHGCHNKLLPSIPDGDIFIHAGDFIYYDDHSTKDFKGACLQVDEFFSKLTHKRKFIVFGNHDQPFCDIASDVIRDSLKNVECLLDEMVEVDGLRIYGSPWTVRRESSSATSFTKQREDMKDVWEKVPRDLDILVTHSPPYALLDGEPEGTTPCKIKCRDHPHLGCPHLRKAILEDIKAKMHVFGHNHRSNGLYRYSKCKTLFCNAAIDMRMYGLPIVVDFHE